MDFRNGGGLIRLRHDWHPVTLRQILRTLREPAPTFAPPTAPPVIKRLLLFLVVLLLALTAHAQAPAQRVELLPGTERLEGGTFNGEEIRKLIGNVRFRQGEVLLYCDSAYQYPAATNRVVCFSNVRLVQGDTVTITGQRLNYDGDAHQARMIGAPSQPVRMQDPRMTLTTDVLDYDLNRRVAYYTTGGHLEDKDNQLDSRRGAYDTQAKTFGFRGNVRLKSPDNTVESDTLNYTHPEQGGDLRRADRHPGEKRRPLRRSRHLQYAHPPIGFSPERAARIAGLPPRRRQGDVR